MLFSLSDLYIFLKFIYSFIYLFFLSFSLSLYLSFSLSLSLSLFEDVTQYFGRKEIAELVHDDEVLCIGNFEFGRNAYERKAYISSNPGCLSGVCGATQK